MSTRADKPAIVDVDIARIEQVLKRARAALSPEDHECLASLIETFVELSSLVRERGTTIARLRRLFGLKSSEKTADVLDGIPPSTAEPSTPAEAASPSDAENMSTGASAAPPGAERDGADDVGDFEADDEPSASPQGHGRIGASEYPDARRVVVEHPTLHVGDACPKCPSGKLYRLRNPARLVRIVGQPPLAATVWECERLRCSSCLEVFTAPAPPDAGGPKYDASAVAMMGVLRYGAGMPLHRLDRLQRNLQTPVPASTQWQVVSDRVSALEPAHEELERRAAHGYLIHNDDTSIRILELVGKRRDRLLEAGELADPERTGLFTTAIVSVTDDGPIALFFSGRKHGGENFGKLLEARDKTLPPPIHMCDGLDRNRPSGCDVIESNCLCHGRRHVVDEVANFPAECRHVLVELRKVFKNDSICSERGLSDEERLRFHERESGPVMTALESWIQAQLDDKRIEPNSGLGQAFRYLLKRWDKLTLFLRVPGAPLDNNLCERILKMAIRHRNNSLFYRSERGAHVGDVFMALIYTAELHGENSLDYLVALLEHEADVAAAPADWLPWTYRATLTALAA